MQIGSQSVVKLTRLPHQDAAIKHILEAFPEVDEGVSCEDFQNPQVLGAFDQNNFIDVEMATGTGKTYTYTKTMFELHARGFSKFIVIVPSSAIKVGTFATLTGEDYKRHFEDEFGSVSLNVVTIDAGDFSARGGRKAIPTKLRNFADSKTPNSIDVLLLNYKGFLDNARSSLFKDDFDTGLFGGLTNPAEMIAETRPVVIIDEPHKMKRDGKAYVNMTAHFKPQMVMRFGATFPEGKKGKTDYYKDAPCHTLTTFDALEGGLVKGVVGSCFENKGTDEFFRVEDAKDATLILEKDGQTYEVEKFHKLSVELNDSRFGDVEYAGKDKEDKLFKLTNEKTVAEGTKLYPAIFAADYQRELISVALDKHFNAERENFVREGFKVKTNALFFIDSIASYRSRGENSNTWLKDAFEEILRDKLIALIKNERDDSYKSFLQASLDNIENCHGGYFAEDNNSKDDKVAEEIDIILKDKAKTLTFKDAQGNWNLNRFFFSKWTLREGWDNPNIFTICKLRSSGSDISRIQEVGRGLRLPVDEVGNRLANDTLEWDLNYIVDETESDFIDELCAEVNATAGTLIKQDDTLTDDVIQQLVEKGYADNKRQVVNKLCEQQIVDDDLKVIDAAKLNELLGAKETTRVRTSNKPERKVKLRRENWNELKNIWKKITQRYMIVFDEVPNLKEKFEEILTDDVFHDEKQAELVERTLNVEENEAGVSRAVEVRRLSNSSKRMNYNKFLCELSNRTCLPTALLHETLKCKFKDEENPQQFMNAQTINNICEKWVTKFAEIYEQKFNYHKLDFHAKTSVYDYESDEFVSVVSAGLVGTIKVATEVDERWLYDEVLVDAEATEKPIAEISPQQEVKVFGKIPKRAIQIPLYTGGTTSPDFVYMKDDELYLVIEAKASQLNQRASDVRAVKAQEQFFYDVLDEQNIIYKEVTNKEEALQALEEFAK